MADLLERSAQAYQELIPFRYHFTLGHKGELRHISLHFPEVAYYHLAGLHRVGIAALSNKKKALEVILLKRVTHEHIIGAGVALEDRWMRICRLKEMIEVNRIIFCYRGHEQPGSMIQADYLMVHEGFALFMAGETPASIFEQRARRYEKGCPRFVTLKIEREDKLTGRKMNLFMSPNFKR